MSWLGEKKLTKVIVPDKWKEGASNTTEGGGRKINENKLLSKKNRCISDATSSSLFLRFLSKFNIQVSYFVRCFFSWYLKTDHLKASVFAQPLQPLFSFVKVHSLWENEVHNL